MRKIFCALILVIGLASISQGAAIKVNQPAFDNMSFYVYKVNDKNFPGDIYATYDDYLVYRNFKKVWYYASFENGKAVKTDYIVGSIVPSVVNIKPYKPETSSVAPVLNTDRTNSKLPKIIIASGSVTPDVLPKKPAVPDNISLPPNPGNSRGIPVGPQPPQTVTLPPKTVTVPRNSSSSQTSQVAAVPDGNSQYSSSGSSQPSRVVTPAPSSQPSQVVTVPDGNSQYSSSGSSQPSQAVTSVPSSQPSRGVTVPDRNSQYSNSGSSQPSRVVTNAPVTQNSAGAQPSQIVTPAPNSQPSQAVTVPGSSQVITNQPKVTVPEVLPVDETPKYARIVYMPPSSGLEANSNTYTYSGRFTEDWTQNPNFMSISKWQKSVDRIGVLDSPVMPVAWKGDYPEVIYAWTGLQWEQIIPRGERVNAATALQRNVFKFTRTTTAANLLNWTIDDTHVLSQYAVLWGYEWLGQIILWRNY